VAKDDGLGGRNRRKITYLAATAAILGSVGLGLNGYSLKKPSRNDIVEPTAEKRCHKKRSEPKFEKLRIPDSGSWRKRFSPPHLPNQER
jgi:hypothetical protein